QAEWQTVRFSGLGSRGDAILQIDWCIGELINTLDRLHLIHNTLIILTSDNGPVVDDGYHDWSVEMLQDHKLAGALRGGKHSAFEGGTRVPFIVHWPNYVSPGVSNALVSQIDLFSSLAALTGQKMPEGAGPDSSDKLKTLLGNSQNGREYVINQSYSGTLSIIKDGWKYIESSDRPKIDKDTEIELGNDPEPQLYNLKVNLGEKSNLAREYPEKVIELSTLLQKIKNEVIF
ncbi:MAG: sulfatase-like hydrolase/transferase, partial [bacterium]